MGDSPKIAPEVYMSTEKIFSFISTTPFVIFNNKNIFFTYYISKISN